jgi:hypothetical protein
MRYRQNTAGTVVHDDQLTVATSVVSGISGAPTSVISKECRKIEDKLRKQK